MVRLDELGFPDYAVTEEGNVISFKNGGPATLNPAKNSRGYKHVWLRSPQSRKWFKVHVLIAKLFIPNPQNLPQINHKDGNKLNNHIKNLEWCTETDNQLHFHRNNKTLRKPVLCVETNITYKNASQAELLNGIYHNGVGSACRSSWKCKGYHWRYVL